MDMCKYQLHQQVEAIVESVQPYGVFVRLNDGTPAYVRRRELDLDRDADPARVVCKGDKITAKVIALGETGKRIELSRRATLPNPWHEFARRVREGDVVRGTVRALHPKGVFVRVEAGIDGFVPLDELATWQVSKLDELLWLNDEVEAIVTHLDAHKEHLTLSIKARLEQRAQATRVVLERVTEPKAESVLLAPEDELPPLTEEERERVGSVIVVDDDDGLRDSLVEWLQQRGYRTSAARTREEVETQIQSAKRGVLLVDIHLSDDDGLELIRGLRANGLLMCVMSSPEWLVERTEEIRAAQVFQIFEKPLDKNANEF